MKITASQAIIDALTRYKMTRSDAKPARMFLGQHAYKSLHNEAKAAGIDCPLYPQNEDERFEYKGMKVFCHGSSAIEFE